MTVTYSATKSFLFLLFKWKGSVWKAVFWQYIIFLIMYYAINISYRFAMTAEQQLEFEKVVQFFKEGNGFIPVQFLLGFYVSKVITNWWNQLNHIAWPDKFLIFVVGNIHGTDDTTRKIRRTLARYVNLTTVLVWKEISLKIKRRFPTLDHVVKAGLMTEHEQEVYQNTSGKYGRWFFPISWVVNILSKCREEGRITDYAHQKLIDELWAFRSGSAMLTMYDWINIPLVYTQVVTLATYGYFAFSLVGRQSLNPESEYSPDVELYFPLFTTLEFLFYIGWLKVGEQLRCPFGEDDDDFDMNFILERNVHISSMMVDDLYNQKLEPSQDAFWDDPEPKLPHTRGSYRVRDPIPPWRLGKFKLKEKDFPFLEKQMEGVRNENLRQRFFGLLSSRKRSPTKPTTTPNGTSNNGIRLEPLPGIQRDPRVPHPNSHSVHFQDDARDVFDTGGPLPAPPGAISSEESMNRPPSAWSQPSNRSDSLSPWVTRKGSGRPGTVPTGGRTVRSERLLDSRPINSISPQASGGDDIDDMNGSYDFTRDRNNIL